MNWQPISAARPGPERLLIQVPNWDDSVTLKVGTLSDAGWTDQFGEQVSPVFWKPVPVELQKYVEPDQFGNVINFTYY